MVEEKGQLVGSLEMWGSGFLDMMCSFYFFFLFDFCQLPFIFQVGLYTLGKKYPK